VLEAKNGGDENSEVACMRRVEARAPGREAGRGVTTKLTSCGFRADGRNGISPELLEIEQQLRSRDLWRRQIGETEGWAISERIPSGGQQLWREGEGSGFWAGEAPAGTPTAAREYLPVHARSGWLTDTVQPKSATIKTTPRDRLAITE